MERLINIKVISDYLGVSPKTVYHWTHTGFIPHYKFPKGIRFRLSEVDNWIKRRKHSGREKTCARNRNISHFVVKLLLFLVQIFYNALNLNDKKAIMKILFLDESGDHNLNFLDPNYPVFVLAGCIMSQKDHDEILAPRMKEFKKNIFGSKRIILHYLDYTRNQNGFESMSDTSSREDFYKQWNLIIAETDFKLVSCIVDKKKHKEKYKTLAIDPYTLSLEIVVERFVKSLEQKNEKGFIVAESRGQQLDNELNLAFLDLKIRGTSFLRPKEIVDRIDGFYIHKKEKDVAGLQLVDSLVTPVGRRFCNRKNTYLNYDVIKSKFRKVDCGKYRGYGLIILPK